MKTITKDTDLTDIEWVLVYNDVSTEPMGFETKKAAIEFKEDEQMFADYDISVIPVNDFINRNYFE